MGSNFTEFGFVCSVLTLFLDNVNDFMVKSEGGQRMLVIHVQIIKITQIFYRTRHSNELIHNEIEFL